MENKPQNFAQYIKNIMLENGNASLTRVIILLSFLLFAIVTIFLVVYNRTFANYDTFAWVCAFTFTSGAIGNKYINSKYNTMEGSFDSKPTTVPVNNSTVNTIKPVLSAKVAEDLPSIAKK